MHGLVVIEGMTLSGHPWIINEIFIIRHDSVQDTFVQCMQQLLAVQREEIGLIMSHIFND